MRLFVSVSVESLTEEIAAIQEPLRGLAGIRPTDPTQAHVTVKFLGEGNHNIEALKRAIERAVDDADIGPFEAHLEGVGVFPNLEYIRVIWLGFGAGSEELSTLHRHVESKATAFGYEAERHDFTPHVTVARMDNAAAKTDVQAFVRESEPEVGTIKVEQFRLTESTLTPDGPTYRTLQRIDL